MRKPLLYLVITAALAAIAVFMRDATPEERLQREADRLHEKVAHASAQLDALCAAVPHRFDPDSITGWRELARLRDSLAHTGTELLLRWYGTRYWTSSLPLDERVLDTAGTGQVRSGASVYLRTGALSKQGSVHALRLIWYQPPFENRYLQKHFHPSLDVPLDVEASVEPGLGPVVRDARGAVLFRLQWAGDGPAPGAVAWLRLLAALAGMAFLLVMAGWSGSEGTEVAVDRCDGGCCRAASLVELEHGALAGVRRLRALHS
jgi:hypothetical protein